MALTQSLMMPLGTRAPTFKLPDPRIGELMSLGGLRGEKGTLVMFICNHCPFVKHLESGLVQLGLDYADSGIGIIAINSNDPIEYPEDHPDEMAKKNYPFMYLFDESQEVAQAYGAVCTPDFFLFDKQMSCVYRGQFDDSTPGNGVAITGKPLRRALDSLLRGELPATEQFPSTGCNIKWTSQALLGKTA